MALETLKGLETIDGFKVIVMDDLREKYPEKFNESGAMDYEWFESEIRPENFVYVRHDKNSISFTIQNGPVGENGVNGCQVDTMIVMALHMISKLNKKVPCKFNNEAIVRLHQAVEQLHLRKKDRENRGVEGTSEK